MNSIAPEKSHNSATEARAPGTIGIRELRRSDGPAFVEILSQSTGPFEHLLAMDDTGPNSMEFLFRPGTWFLLRLMRTMGRPLADFFVATDGAERVGTTILGFRKSYGYVAGVGVRTTHRRRKVGSQLMDRAEEVARARGKAWAVLDVEGENRPAIELYQHRGYESIQTTEWLRGDDLAQIASHSVRPSESRLVGRSEAKAAAEWCRARIPTPFSSIVPPTPGTLTHLEVIAQMRGVKRRAWAVGPPGGTHAYLRGYWRPPPSPGILFLPAVDPLAPRERLLDLVTEGVAWMRSEGSTSVVAAVPDPARSAVAALEEIGFQRRLTTLTMALRLSKPAKG